MTKVDELAALADEVTYSVVEHPEGAAGAGCRWGVQVTARVEASTTCAVGHDPEDAAGTVLPLVAVLAERREN
jgi:hypothetical protein